MMNVVSQLIQYATDMDPNLVEIVYEYSGFEYLLNAIDTIYEECCEGSKCSICFYDGNTINCDGCRRNICGDCMNVCPTCMSNVCSGCSFYVDCKNCRLMRLKIYELHKNNITNKKTIILMRRYIYDFRNEDCRYTYDSNIEEQLKWKPIRWRKHYKKCPADYMLVDQTNDNRCSHCAKYMFCFECIKKECIHCHKNICFMCFETECFAI